MMTRVIFFGPLKETAGAAELIVELPEHIKDVESLISFVADNDPNLIAALAAPSVRIALDHEIITNEVFSSTPKEVAFMPPFSGG